MKKNKQLVFFDFCETLVDFQTADRYVEFCRNRLRYKRMYALQGLVKLFSFCFKVIDRMIPGISLRKRIILTQLRGINYDTLNNLAREYYEMCIKPSLILITETRLHNHLYHGDEVWIVSGGYDLYIRYFVNDYKVKGYMATNIAFTSEGICKGNFDGIDCIRRNKVLLIENKMSNRLKEIQSVAYSDSISDLPMLLMVNEGYVVSKEKSQKWVKNNHLKEIVWK